MEREVTHRKDADGLMRQLVSPRRLREILDADGEDYTPPSGFGPGDEWEVETLSLDRDEELAAEGDWRHDEQRDWDTVHGGDR